MTEDGEGVVPATTIAGIALASALVPLNSTMIAVALPDIAERLRHLHEPDERAHHALPRRHARSGSRWPVASATRSGRAASPSIATTGFGVCSAAAMLSRVLLVARRAPSAAGRVRLGARPERAGDAPRAHPGAAARPRLRRPGLGDRRRGRPRPGDRWARHGRLRLASDLRRQPPGRAGRALRAPAPGAGAVHRRRADRRRRRSTVPSRCSTPVFGAAFATQALSTLAQYALLLAVPIVLDSRGWSAAGTGFALSFLTIGMVVMGPYRRTPR